MYAALIGLFIWHSEYVVDLGGCGERVVPHFYIFVLHGLCCLECVIEFKERLFETWSIYCVCGKVAPRMASWP